MLCRGARKKAVGRNLPSSSEQTSAAGVSSIEPDREARGRLGTMSTSLSAMSSQMTSAMFSVIPTSVMPTSIAGAFKDDAQVRPRSVRILSLDVESGDSAPAPLRSDRSSDPPRRRSNRIESNRSVARASPRSRARRSHARRPPRPSLTRPDPPRSPPANESNRPSVHPAPPREIRSRTTVASSTPR